MKKNYCKPTIEVQIVFTENGIATASIVTGEGTSIPTIVEETVQESDVEKWEFKLD